jgi:hypothetical protein
VSEVSTGPRLVEVGALERARALLVVRLAIALYLFELLLNATRPGVLPNEPTLSIFYKLPELSGSATRLFSMPRAIFWTVLAGIAVGAAIQGFAAIKRTEGRLAVILTWATLVALLGPFALVSLAVISVSPLAALACVPSTIFVLCLLRFARLPWRVMLAAFGWGALIVFGMGRAYSGLFFGTIYGYIGKPDAPSTDITAQFKSTYRVIDFMILHLSVVNTLAVAAGVLVLLLLFRHLITDVVTGLVLGATVGLGYSFVESALFIQLWGSLSFINGATGGFEYWIRQSIGLLGGQVAFGALLGAGIGVALRARQRRQRRLAALAGMVAAVGGAVATETLAGLLSRLLHDHIGSGGAFDTLVISPFIWLLPQSPFIIVAALLLVIGLRARAATAKSAIQAEAAESTAITHAEVPFLGNPTVRFWTLVATWRRHGWGTALALYRLQSAQLDLISWRAQADTTSAHEEEGHQLRTKVMRLKTGETS